MAENVTHTHRWLAKSHYALAAFGGNNLYAGKRSSRLNYNPPVDHPLIRPIVRTSQLCPGCPGLDPVWHVLDFHKTICMLRPLPLPVQLRDLA